MSHEFAFFIPQLSVICAQKSAPFIYMLNDQELVHRMVQVLRLQKNDACIFFDSQIHATITICEIIKNKTINVRIEKITLTVPLKPMITFLLPILKKEALEEAVYALVETGINRIVLITSTKTQRHWGGHKEIERLQRIIIAAAEQSKQFAPVQLIEPAPLKQACDNYVSNKKAALFFDVQGTALVNSFLLKKDVMQESITVLIGPEGDLTEQEKELVDGCGFVRIKLTPTILRASQAAALGAGIIRSLV